MADPKEELRDWVAGRIFDTYGQGDTQRSKDIADAVLRGFSVRVDERDIEVSSLGDSHQQLMQHRWLVAEVCTGTRMVRGEPIGWLVDAESPDPGVDDLYPGPETGGGDRG